MIEIRRLTAADAEDLNQKNEPFDMPGLFVPSLRDGVWTYEERLFDSADSMCFPDFPYDPAEVEQQGFALGAYDGETCLGVAIFRREMFRYLYLDDLKVRRAARGRGAGRLLVEAGLAEAQKMGLRGISVTAQDNNLLACRFYLRCGFLIGGFDNRVYTGTNQAGKANIEFYLDGKGEAK